jgi:hypothetical protein
MSMKGLLFPVRIVRVLVLFRRESGRSDLKHPQNWLVGDSDSPPLAGPGEVSLNPFYQPTYGDCLCL